MSVSDVFNEDIVLDEAAFARAVERFTALSERLKTLQSDIQEMLDILERGFDTPAGRKLIKTCKANLFDPLKDQERVLKHISESLQESKQAYESVFQAYEELQTTIKQINT